MTPFNIFLFMLAGFYVGFLVGTECPCKLCFPKAKREP